MSDTWISSEEQIDQRRLTTELVRASRATIWVLLTVLAVLFAVRRLSGEMRQALPGELFMIFAFCVEVLVGWLRWPSMSRHHANESVTRLPAWPGWMDEVGAWWTLNRESLLRVGRSWIVGAVVVVLLVGAFSLPGTGVTALLGGWLLVLWLEGAYFAFGCGWRRIGAREAGSAVVPANQDETLPVSSTAIPAFGSIELAAGPTLVDEEELSEEFEVDEGGEVMPADVVQLTTRSRLPDGSEAIEQFVRCTFTDSDPLRVVHVGYCPPLNTKPKLEIDQLAGPEAKLKATLAESFGARVEVRLLEPSEEPAEVVLRLYAVG
jgi:hypothetical protein